MRGLHPPAADDGAGASFLGGFGGAECDLAQGHAERLGDLQRCVVRRLFDPTLDIRERVAVDTHFVSESLLGQSTRTTDVAHRFGFHVADDTRQPAFCQPIGLRSTMPSMMPTSEPKEWPIERDREPVNDMSAHDAAVDVLRAELDAHESAMTTARQRLAQLEEAHRETTTRLMLAEGAHRAIAAAIEKLTALG